MAKTRQEPYGRTFQVRDGATAETIHQFIWDLTHGTIRSQTFGEGYFYYHLINPKQRVRYDPNARKFQLSNEVDASVEEGIRIILEKKQ